MSLGSKQAKFDQYIPPDVKGLRGGAIGLLQGIQQYGANDPHFQNGFFGQLGNPQTDLQRQATGGISQFLNQPAPEQRAFDTSMPALQGILNGKPGQGVIDAMQPQFQQNLALANQQGGRFGSANAVLRGNAVNDFNLLAAQAAQQGQQTQLQAANALGILGNYAGQNPFQRYQGAYGIGEAQANQNDQETQRRLQILLGMLGVGQQTGLNLPIQQVRGETQGVGQQVLGGLIQAGGQAAGAYFGRP